MKFFEWIKIQIESWIESRRFNKSLDRRCESCESLKQINAHLISQNNLLIGKITDPTPIVEKDPIPVTRPIQTGWNARRRELEDKSRKEALALSNKLSEDKNKELNELEQEVVNATK